MEEANSKKNKKKRIAVVFAILGLLVTVIQVTVRVYDFYSSRELQHFFGESAQYITDLSAEEQAELLAVYDVIIPEKEEGAYISAFGKVDYHEGYCVCFIEFDGVDSFQAFYDANTHREPSINQTTNNDGNMHLVYGERILPSREDNQHIAELFDRYSEKQR